MGARVPSLNQSFQLRVLFEFRHLSGQALPNTIRMVELVQIDVIVTFPESPTRNEALLDPAPQRRFSGRALGRINQTSKFGELCETHVRALFWLFA
jgi:hypothetical protein